MFIAWEVKRSKKEVKTINCKNAKSCSPCSLVASYWCKVYMIDKAYPTTTTTTTNQNNQKTTYLVTHNERYPSSRYTCFPCDIDICSDCAGKEVKGVFFSRIKHFLQKKEGRFPSRPNCLTDSGDVV